MCIVWLLEEACIAIRWDLELVFIRDRYTDTSMLKLSPAYRTLNLYRKGSCHRIFVLPGFRSTSMCLVW